jgi:hypothetical protein
MLVKTKPSHPLKNQLKMNLAVFRAPACRQAGIYESLEHACSCVSLLAQADE